MDNKNEDKIKEDVLEKIQEGEIKMKSKSFFVAKVIILSFFAFLVFLTSAFLISFIIFDMRTSNHLFLLGFGLRGVETFIIIFPWIVLLADAVFIFILEKLLKRFRFGYLLPASYLFTALIVFAVAISFVMDLISFNEMVFEKARNNHISPVEYLYEGIDSPHEDLGLFRGEVISVGSDYIIIKNIRCGANSNLGGLIKVSIPDGFDSGSLSPGDTIFIAGDISSSTIDAYGLGKADFVQQCR